MIPPKTITINYQPLKTAEGTPHVYISVEAIKEFIYGNYGADDFMEKFNEFIQ